MKNIQSLSVVVPAKGCINDCKFCVSKMHKSEYENFITGRNLYFDLYMKDYLDRLQYARDNGCNTVMLTGDCEPQQNYEFLKLFGIFNKMLPNPFKNIEMQTTGTLLDEPYLYFLRHHVGVTTISLSISSFVDSTNAKIIGMKNPIDLARLCKLIKQYRFTLRLSINLNKVFKIYSSKGILNRCSELGADQVTFRVLYTSADDTEQDKWIKANKYPIEKQKELEKYIIDNGELMEILEFGQYRFSVHGMSTVVDNDCMSTEAKDALKYLILRPDCKLYTKWDKKDSRLF